MEGLRGALDRARYVQIVWYGDVPGLSMPRVHGGDNLDGRSEAGARSESSPVCLIRNGVCMCLHRRLLKDEEEDQVRWGNNKVPGPPAVHYESFLAAKPECELLFLRRAPTRAGENGRVVWQSSPNDTAH